MAPGGQPLPIGTRLTATAATICPGRIVPSAANRAIRNITHFPEATELGGLGEIA